MVINSERLMLDAGHCEDEGRSRILDTGYWMLDTECWIVVQTETRPVGYRVKNSQ